MSSNADAAIDLERFELRLFPHDPPPACDLQAEENRLPYDLSAAPPETAARTTSPLRTSARTSISLPG